QGLTRRAVQCQLRALERRGELERMSPGMGGRWKSTRYRIRVRKGASHAPFLPTERGHLATRKGASDDLKGRTTCAQKVREGEKGEREARACSADAEPSLKGPPLKAGGNGRSASETLRRGE